MERGLAVDLFGGEAEGCEFVSGAFGHAADHDTVALEVELEAEGAETGAVGLDLARLRGGEEGRAVGEARDLVAVGVELLVSPRDAGEDGLGLTGDGDVDGGEAVFGAIHGGDVAAERGRDELGAEADADDGEFGLVGCLEEGEFGVHPVVGLADVLRSAEGEDARDVVEVGREGGCAEEVQSADVETEAVVAERDADAPGDAFGAVLEDDDACHGRDGMRGVSWAGQ